MAPESRIAGAMSTVDFMEVRDALNIRIREARERAITLLSTEISSRRAIRVVKACSLHARSAP
jgi:hypothetical protein